MAIEFECPNCRTLIRTPDEAAGKKARCPRCQLVSPVPLSSSLPSAGGFSQTPQYSPPPEPPKPPPASEPPPLTSQPLQPMGGTNAGAWLPPADAFAPQGPPAQAYPPYQPPPTSTNPFGEFGGSGGAINPYQSPAYGAAPEVPLSPEELRQKLVGPAIGMLLGAALCIGVVAFFAAIIWFDEDFHDDIKGANNADTVGAYIAFAFFILVGIGPSLLSLLAPWAMFRGRGLVTAWLGAIAGLLPCNPCFFVSAGFSIWAMVVLSDPRVNKGMQ
jgi:hypothetical protein